MELPVSSDCRFEGRCRGAANPLVEKCPHHVARDDDAPGAVDRSELANGVKHRHVQHAVICEVEVLCAIDGEVPHGSRQRQDLRHQPWELRLDAWHGLRDRQRYTDRSGDRPGGFLSALSRSQPTHGPGIRAECVHEPFCVGDTGRKLTASPSKKTRRPGHRPAFAQLANVDSERGRCGLSAAKAPDSWTRRIAVSPGPDRKPASHHSLSSV